MKMGIIIPTINRSDLLKELLDSLNSDMCNKLIDYIYIIDNGNQHIDINIYLNLNSKITVFEPGINLGVSGSWNKGISYFRDSDFDWVLILNDDIVIDHEGLSKAVELRNNNPDKLIVVGGMWCAYLINLKQIFKLEYDTDKYFDEQFYPAYFEDNDFDYRVKLINENLRSTDSIPIKLFRNSMTIAKDPGLNKNFNLNSVKYIRKWGGMPGYEQFIIPYNKP